MLKRLPSYERKLYFDIGYRREPKVMEPALGTLDERLDILIRRAGGRAKVVAPLDWERKLAAHLLAGGEMPKIIDHRYGGTYHY